MPWISIDWLVVKQSHFQYGGSLPKVGVWVNYKRNLLMDFVTFERVSGLKHEGSWQSSLRVTCDGLNVEVSGNPSRFGRIDNLFGFRNILDAVEVFQKVLCEYGLPRFDFDENNINLWAHNSRGRFRFCGASFHRVDLCCNHMSGSVDNARQFLIYLSGLPSSRGLVPHIFADGNTVDYGGNSEGKAGTKWVYRKWYIKAKELEKNLFNISVKEGLSEDDSLYIDRLLKYVSCCGIVRFEVSFKRRFLVQKGLQTMDRVVRLFDEFQRYEGEHLIEDGGRVVEKNQMPGTSLIGVDLGWCVVDERFATKINGAYYEWLNGEDLRKKMSRATFYRVRSALKFCGVDIYRPCTVVRMPVEVRKIFISPVESPPDWYRLPGA